MSNNWGHSERTTLGVLDWCGRDGITARELAERLSPGDVSGVNQWGQHLTRLRQRGRIVALAEEREGHHVYVLPERVGGRKTWRGYKHHCAGCTCNRDEDK
jgi:hypothetical protein